MALGPMSADLPDTRVLSAGYGFGNGFNGLVRASTIIVEGLLVVAEVDEGTLTGSEDSGCWGSSVVGLPLMITSRLACFVAGSPGWRRSEVGGPPLMVSVGDC